MGPLRYWAFRPRTASASLLHTFFTPVGYTWHREIKGCVIDMRLGFGFGALWMIVLRALPVLAMVTPVAALAGTGRKACGE